MRRLLARLGLALGGLLAGVLLAELGARLVAPAGNADLLFNAPTTTPPGLYVNDPELLLTPAANFSADVHSVGYTVHLRTNALGLRGPQVPPKSDTPRWLVVGDSFTMSQQVPEDQVFTALLARQAGIEAWNAGVDGYSTWQALGRYRKLASPLDPDGVLLVFFLGNDLQDNAHFEERLRGARGRAAGTPIPIEPVGTLQRFLLGHSYLYAHLRVWRRARALRSGVDPMRMQWRSELSIFTHQGADELRRGVGWTRPALEQLRDEVAAHGARLIVAIAPPAFVIDTARVPSTLEMVGLDPAQADLDAPERALNTLLAGANIQGCDLVPALRAAADQRPLYLTYDGHWTAAGHRVVADTLARCLATPPPLAGRPGRAPTAPRPESGRPQGSGRP